MTLVASVSAGTLGGCATKVMKVEKSQEILKNDEFEQAIKVEAYDPSTQSGEYVRLPGPDPVPGAFPDPPTTLPGPPAAQSSMKVKGKGGKNASKPLVGRNAKAPVAAPASVPSVPVATPIPAREPGMEDAEGFEGRRPKVIPWRMGEKVTLEVSYFGVVAGDMTLEMRPYVQVNGRKSYNFVGTARSTSVFAMFYAVDDWFETYVDFETLVPSSYALHVKESKQLRETRSVFDWSKMMAFYWDKKINPDEKVEERKMEWEIPSYAQNIFSAPYYLRAFQLKPGKKITFRVSHEKENLVVTAEVLGRERITTPAGEFNTVKVKPHIELNGVFKPVGDIFFWMTDDDRKFIVKIESKIKIGTIVGIAKKVETGIN